MPPPGGRILALIIVVVLVLLGALPGSCTCNTVADSGEECDDNESVTSAEVLRRLRHAGGAAARSAHLVPVVAAEDDNAAATSSEEDVAMVADDPTDGGDAVKHPRGTSPFLQLYCRTGYNLVIHAGGKVNGTREDRNRYGESRPMPYPLSPRSLATLKPAAEC